MFMRKLRIGIIDLVSKDFSPSLYGKVMRPNLAGIMPQVLAVWLEEMGHDIDLICFTGYEDLFNDLAKDVDIVFVSAFTQAAQLAYSISGLFQKRGVITVLGGPHARCYPQDAVQYYDYVLGITDKEILNDLLSDLSQHRPIGQHLSAKQHPISLPGVKERWKFIEQTLSKAPLIKIVPMIASVGCPFTCSFCIDSDIDYQLLDMEVMKEDLQFILTKYKRPLVGWHDPNFGIRFNSIMEAIESSIPANSIDFVAETSLSVLTEEHVIRLQKNGFKGLLPGIESWYELGSKSRTGKSSGLEKVHQAADKVNMILKYIPYMQVNFVVGMDSDKGVEPFELTNKFLDLSPASFPAYSLMTAFGEAAPVNLEYQKANRVIPVPFHFLNNNNAMNLKPLNYSWPEFYDNLIMMSKHSFSKKAIFKRLMANRGSVPRWMNLLRAVSSEGWGRIKYHTMMKGLFETDNEIRDFFEGSSTKIPQFYIDKIKHDLGPFWEYLPDGAIEHDPNAYLNSLNEKSLMAV